ncbi:MAG: hypothetical protein ACE5JU_08030 [Candidatus Binatia bacterium]
MELPTRAVLFGFCSASGEMLLAILLLSVAIAAAYNYFTVPGLCAEIARRKGLDEKKWYFNGLFLSGVALLYLRSALSPSEGDLKKRIDRVLVISVAIVIWIIGLAVYLDASGY